MRAIDGRRCSACGFEARTERELAVRPRDWRVITVGFVGLAAGIGLVPMAIWVRTWEGGGAAPGLVLHPVSAVFWGVGCFGIVLAGWGLRGDRSRGRRRCPKCWYDMSSTLHEGPHASLRCPECGHEPSGARALYRARRYRRVVWLGVAMFVVGLCAQTAPRAMRVGPLGLVPTTVLIAGMDWLPVSWYQVSPRGVSRGTLGDRISEIEVWRWQEAWAARLARGDAASPRSLERWAAALSLLNDRRPENALPATRGCLHLALRGGFDRDEAEIAAAWKDCASYVRVAEREPETPESLAFLEKLESSQDALVAMIDPERPSRTSVALRLLGLTRRPGRQAIEPTFRYMLGGSRDRGFTGGVLLARIGAYDDAAVARLIDASRGADRGLRSASISLLGNVLLSRPDLPEVGERLFEAALHEENDRDAGLAAALLLLRSPQADEMVLRLGDSPDLRPSVRARLAWAVLGRDMPVEPRVTFVLPLFGPGVPPEDLDRAVDSIRRASSRDPERAPGLLDALRVVRDRAEGEGRLRIEQLLAELTPAEEVEEAPAVVDPGG